MSIAHALYNKNADLFIFDDSLASVDVHVSGAIFDDAILGMLKDKTRIIVLSSNYHFLPHFDRVIIVQNGAIVANGAYAEVVAAYPAYASLDGEAREALQVDKAAMIANADAAASATAEKEEEEEELNGHKTEEHDSNMQLSLAVGHELSNDASDANDASKTDDAVPTRSSPASPPLVEKTQQQQQQRLLSRDSMLQGKRQNIIINISSKYTAYFVAERSVH